MRRRVDRSSGDRHVVGLADLTPPVLAPLQFRDVLTEAAA